MAISHVADDSGFSNSFIASFTVDVPLGTTDGDLMIVSCLVPGNRLTAPAAGWTAGPASLGSASSNITLQTFYRFASSEPASYTFNITTSLGAASTTKPRWATNVYRDVAAVAAEAGSAISTSTTVTYPALGAVANGVVVRAGAAGLNSGSTITFSTPTGHTPRAAVAQPSTLVTFDISHAAGAVPSATSTISDAAAWAGHTLALEEVATATNLVVEDAAHAHAADSVALVQQHELAVADATHLHTTDAIGLTLSTAVTVSDARHAHTADAVAFTQESSLTVADVLHGHTADAAHPHTGELVLPWFFTPPTQPSSGPSGKNAFTRGEMLRQRMHRVIGTVDQGINLYIKDGVVHAKDLIPADADFIYLGGRTHTITSAEKDILEAAGYTVV